MARVEAAWLAGDIGVAQVTHLAGAFGPATSKCFERDEADLVDAARRLTYRKFVRVMSYWRQPADADGVEDNAGTQQQARRLHLSEHRRSLVPRWGAGSDIGDDRGSSADADREGSVRL